MFDVIDGNQVLAAVLELMQEGERYPSQLKAKVYATNPHVTPLEMALFNDSRKKEFPLSYLDKIVIVRKYLEMNKICRDSASSENPNEIKKIFNQLFPLTTAPQSMQYLVGVDVDTFDKLFKISQKFSKNEICYTKDIKKKCDPQYKIENIQVLNSEKFWYAVTRGLKINSAFILQKLAKLSNSYGIVELLEDIKDVPINLNQQLENVGITYSKTLEEARREFGMPESTTAEQCYFLLTNRKIQKQATDDKPGRTLDSSETMRETAKSRIAEFLKAVNTVNCESADCIPNLVGYNFIVCFEPLKWKDLILPDTCLIFDLCKENDKKIGPKNILPIWNINIRAEEIQKPVDVRLPNLSTLLRVFYYVDEATEDNQAAIEHFKEKIEANNIRTGSEIQKIEITELFHLAENKSKCLIYQPPLEWIEILAASCLSCKCNSITIVTPNEEIFDKFKNNINNGITIQWHAVAKEFVGLKTPKKRKRQSANSVDSQPASPDAPPKPKRNRRTSKPLASTPQSQQEEEE